MGPTASGKTPLAVYLAQHYPVEIVSVDSTMVYRGMDIGTAKPDAATLQLAPHHLINLADPSEPYSAGQFRADALQAIQNIIARNKVPLLVGGTMLYFRVLQLGLALLPEANMTVRQDLQARALQEGWQSLHDMLKKIDPFAAKRIHPNDQQRIQRALEVYILTGKTISAWQTEQTYPLEDYEVVNLTLLPLSRQKLKQSIVERFQHMMNDGFVAEARALYERGDLTEDLPSMRSVGYRQMWQYFAGKISYPEMCELAMTATRQLAKRQMTWLRSWPKQTIFASDAHDLYAKIEKHLNNMSLL